MFNISTKISFDLSWRPKTHEVILTLPTNKKAAFSRFISTTCQGDFGSKEMNLLKIDHVILGQFRHALQRADGDSSTNKKPRPELYPSLPERKAG